MLNYRPASSSSLLTTMNPTMSLASLWYDRAVRSPQIVTRFLRSVALPFHDVILCSYLRDGRVGQNWGDKLNPVLVAMISGKTVLNVHSFYNLFNMPVYMVIGSGLGSLRRPDAIVWGQGFARYDERLRVRPRKICAVRGPLSRQKILASGLDCPEVVGDPALLLPRYFNEDVAKQHRIGLIPHFSHLELFEFSRLREQGAEIIDITGDLFDVVRSVKSCHMVASSSLHGLIMADAYGVPSKWLQVDGYPIEDGFKFHDYLKSVGRNDATAFVVDEKSSVKDIENSFCRYEVSIDLHKLYESCPFRGPIAAAPDGERIPGSAGKTSPCAGPRHAGTDA